MASFTKDEMIEQLLMQVNTLTVALNSLQHSFDAQTALITKPNQTIQELKEQINKNSQNSSKPPSSDGFKKPSPKKFTQTFRKEGWRPGRPSGYLFAVIAGPDDVIGYMPSACEGCPHYQMCKGTACVVERRHVIDAVVTVNVTGHQLLEIPVCMLHGDNRKGSFPAGIKVTVQ